ncbi:DUF3575 domain-containing protein [Parabacteroides pacaensis]|uniref:DUF3575 domain-containing protein n=1 Tax=Parabacteroides pacaensis TaxID=2086575 RepID=UPI000D1139C9|nr:DUF3575 domain-containing protein [Parabacteroides pacaensis]
MKKIFLTLFFLAAVQVWSHAQRVAVKTNLLYDATTTLNLGCEVALQKHLTIDVSGNYNPFTFSDDKSIKHWLVQPELRYWILEAFNGHYIGLHGQYGDYDIAGQKLPFGMKSKYCYDGFAYGGGISYGYQLYLSPHWNVEFTVGGGYTYFEYDKYNYPKGQQKLGKFRNHYWGLTKAGISIVYIIR